MANELKTRIETGTLDLPILPEVASQVMALTSGDDCDVRQLSELLTRDAAMAGHVLRLANSPLYMPRVPIESLQQAVARLGLNKVREIAWIISCEARFFEVRGYKTLVRSIFDHSLAAAAFAQELAKVMGQPTEESFLGGLLHDIGRPMLLQAISDLGADGEQNPNEAQVQSFLDPHHAEVGWKLTQHWSLPEYLQVCVRHHHRPEQATGYQDLCQLIELADQLAHWATGDLNDEQVQALPHWRNAGISTEERNQILQKLDSIIATLEALSA
jgi:putative nucleotidyltransferase with HDIG domain